MANEKSITSAINAFRARLTPSSITPKDVADLLQAIFDFVQALSLAPQSQLLDLTTELTKALNAATAALETANSANTNANNQHITLFDAAQGAASVILKLKQAGSATLQLSLPLATAQKAGLLSKEQYAKIEQTGEKVDESEVVRLEAVNTPKAIQLKIVRNDGRYVDCDLLGATTEKAGLMTAADKELLDGLPTAEKIAQLEDSGALKARQAPYTLLLNVEETTFDEPFETGDNFFDNGHIYHFTANRNIDLGVPSKDLTYCLKSNGALYRWDGQNFTPCTVESWAGIELREVGASSAASKRYDIPAGTIAIIKPTTDTANINLLPGMPGRSPIHRMIIEKADALSLVDEQGKGLKWMQDILWENANAPALQDINFNAGIVVTVLNRRYGSFYVVETVRSIENS